MTMTIIDRLLRLAVIVISLAVLFTLMLYAELWIDVGIRSYAQCVTVFCIAIGMLIASVISMTLDYSN